MSRWICTHSDGPAQRFGGQVIELRANVSPALCDAHGREMPFSICRQVQLEAAAPAHGNAASVEDQIVAVAYDVTDGQLGAVYDTGSVYPQGRQ